MSNNNSNSLQPIVAPKKGRKPKVEQTTINDIVPVVSQKSSRKKAPLTAAATITTPPILNNIVLPQPINTAHAKIEFDKFLEMKKPDDPLDYLVTLADNKRCDETKIKKNSLLFRPSRIVVLSDNHLMGASVRNQDLFKANIDSDWNLGLSLIGQQCWSPDHYTKVEKASLTQIAHKLKEEVGECVCKIEFTKEAETATMSSLIHEGSKLILSSGCTDAEKEKMFTKLYERSKKGDIRIMRGYIIRSADLHMEQNDTGMIRFLDADLLAQNKMAERLVNVRNIISLTFKLTKYQLK